MRLFAVAVMLFIGTLVFNIGGMQAHAQTRGEKDSKTHKSSKRVAIKPGDTLVSIAKEHGSSYKRIFYANKNIKNPDVIYPDDEVRIPAKSEKLKKRPLNKPMRQVIVPRSQVRTQPYTPSQNPEPTYSSSNDSGSWNKLAQCESGGNWSTNTGNGYYGGLQFSASTWQSVGGSGLPHQASKAEQIARAKILQSRSGWGAWPACTSQIGLR